MVLLLPLVMSAAMLGVTIAAFCTGSPMAHQPTFLAFPALMSVSMAVTALTGRGRRRGAALNADRARYFSYLSELRREITEHAMEQRDSMMRRHPDPDVLWTLVGSTRMWEQRPDGPASWVVRIGVGTVPLATSLVAAQCPAGQRCDPIAAEAQRRFLDTHSSTEAPVVIRLDATVTIDGTAPRVRGLLRAIVCQLAVLYSPEHLAIGCIVSDSRRSHWDWLKWLPHHRHPAEAVAEQRTVLVIDTPESNVPVPDGVTVLRVGNDEPVLRVLHCGGIDVLDAPDWLDEAEAVACARRLAHTGESVQRDDASWTQLIGLGLKDIGDFDPKALWCNVTQLLGVPIGNTGDGRPLCLDIREAAQHGMGPHGLCVGATGSGKSELLRTIALGMMVRTSPEVLNLLLIDFKGGATFLDFAGSAHVAAVVTNLADEAPLVARMREALAGEMNRRQQLLRAAGSVSATAYNQSREPGARVLPALLVIVDEFSELLSQHPDFADTFVAIGRLGRSLGMHLLLASQRLDEGRLRGLEAHLSYRICLKTLSASESRTALGTLDAYQLPSVPGAGFLRVANGEPLRFQAACVSGPAPRARAVVTPSKEVRRFTAWSQGVATRELRGPSVLHLVLGRLAGHGPRAHQVWLPPLQAAPSLRSLLSAWTPTRLAVPIGLVDLPYDQSRLPLTVDLSGAAGNVVIVGAPQSGKSTALRTLITALAATHDPRRAQFYCLDFGGGILSSLRELPHVGGVADRGRPELIWRMITEIETVLHTREATCRGDPTARGGFADVFLVADGWASLRHEFEAVEHAVTAIASQGLSYGVHVVLTASRWAELRPALKDQLGTRIELRLGDPADSELDRKQARYVPGDRPGRGLAHDGSHMMIALPTPDEIEVRRGTTVAPPITLLPGEVGYESVVAGDPGAILLGIEERSLAPLAIDFDHGRHLLILGDNGCGKTSALRTLCREILRTADAAQAQLFVVDFRRTLLGVVDGEQLGGYAMSPASLIAMLAVLVDIMQARMPGTDVTQAQLRSRSWWTGPEIYVVMDDYDLVVGSSSGSELLKLLEYLPYAADLGLHVITARRIGGASRALFEPLLAGLRDLGCMTMMMSGRPEDGPLLGPRPPVPLPPGRGVLSASPGVEQRVQVAWSPPG
ncbi:type VII secretion protein EccCb [Mycobacterium vicinigordonae]|uniref:Type VII secretion protein EccCb n=2 Tax=Mycobacterium vicinigordonae TaxID=1719132 RepID=A0A7D6IAU2_9MYCO|nr:type VII secretion protein EccCb [Mycobacterium vicinigordonae]QLL10016.1 type VII secretion protein EccCb [Mycobacterium vicinigordonae]